VKSVIISLMIFILVTPAWAGTLVYDFEDESQLADWSAVPTLDRLPYTARWSVENGELVAFSSDPALGMGQGLGVGDDTWGNYIFEAQFMIERIFSHPDSWAPAIFLVVHYHLPPGITDPTRWWMVWLGPDHPVDTGVWEMHWWESGSGHMSKEDFDSPFEENRWYTARIECEDDHYRMFFEDKLFTEFDTEMPDDAYGVAGFAVRNCEARFDNVIITGDSIPNMLSVAAVSPRSKLATTWGCIRK
jgi:hypothetical protein